MDEQTIDCMMQSHLQHLGTVPFSPTKLLYLVDKAALLQANQALKQLCFGLKPQVDAQPLCKRLGHLNLVVCNKLCDLALRWFG